MSAARALGPELTAEGWVSFAGETFESFHWLCGRDPRSVSIDGPRERSTCTRVLGDPETAPETIGYVVVCRRHDDLGNPIEGTAFWVESFAEAWRRARAIRSAILAEYPPIQPAEQGDLFADSEEA